MLWVLWRHIRRAERRRREAAAARGEEEVRGMKIISILDSMIWSLTDAITPPRLGAGRKAKRRKMTAMERRGPGVECAHNHKSREMVKV